MATQQSERKRPLSPAICRRLRRAAFHDRPSCKVIAKDFRYIFNAFDNVANARAVLSDGFIIDRLRRNGMLMAAWRVQDPTQPKEVFFHARIVWGVIYLA